MEQDRMNSESLAGLYAAALAGEISFRACAEGAMLARLLDRRAALAAHIVYLYALIEAVHQEARTLLGSAQWRLGAKLPGVPREADAAATLDALFRGCVEWELGYRERASAFAPNTGSAWPGARPDNELAAIYTRMERELAEFEEDIVFLVERAAALNAWARGVRQTPRFRRGDLAVAQLAKFRLRPASAAFLQRLDAYSEQLRAWLAAYQSAATPRA